MYFLDSMLVAAEMLLIALQQMALYCKTNFQISIVNYRLLSTRMFKCKARVQTVQAVHAFSHVVHMHLTAGKQDNDLQWMMF